MTPVQIGKNIYALMKKPDPRQPTAALYRVVSSNMAAQALANQRWAAPTRLAFKHGRLWRYCAPQN